MARNGRERREEDESPDELRKEVAVRREAVKRTAAALEDRLRERTEQVGEVFDRTRDRLQEVDRAVQKYRYLFIGGAVGLGFALARRRRARDIQPKAAAEPARYILVERSGARPGLLRSLAGGAAALALRQGLGWLTHRLEESGEPDEPLLLPPARPRR